MTTILVVEDDPSLRNVLRTAMRDRQLEVLEAETGAQARIMTEAGTVDLVVLNLGLPDVDGLDLLRELRTFTTVPVIVLTARDLTADKIAALDSGADDYVTKPFNTDELLARIRALLRRVTRGDPVDRIVTIDELEIDLTTRQVQRAGVVVSLTYLELELLEELVRNPGKLLSREYLLRAVWGPEYGTEGNYLRVYVAQLRKKLGDDAANPRLILTEPGIGYRWIAAGAHD